MKKLTPIGFAIVILFVTLFPYAGNAQAKLIPDKKESNTPWVSFSYTIDGTSLTSYGMAPTKRGETLKLELVNINDPHPLWYTLKLQYQVIRSNRLVKKLSSFYKISAYIPEAKYNTFLKLYDSKGNFEKSRSTGPLYLY